MKFDKELFKDCGSVIDAAFLEDMLVINHNREIVNHLKEYLKVMESEPAEDLIKLKDVYHNLRRILGDE